MTNHGDISLEPERPPRSVRSGEVVAGSREPQATAGPDAKRATRAQLAPGAPPRTGQDGDGKPHLSGIERTVGMIRAAVPLVQKVLPLLDGNVALALANLLVPRLQAPPVNLHPVESSIAQLRGELASLGEGTARQEATLRHVEQEVEAVKDSLERSVTAHGELKADLERVRTRITVLSILGFLLLAVSIAANAILLVRATH